MPAAPLPTTTGVAIVVVRSPAGGVSDAGSRPGAGGAAGAVPSIVSVNDTERPLLLPALSNAAAVIVYVPSLSGVVVADQSPPGPVSAPPTPTTPAYSWIELPGSAVPVKFTPRYLVMPSPWTPES